MSLKVSLLSWWPFSGYSGQVSGSEVLLPNDMLKFFVRFVLFNIATFIVWYFVHSYYETILWLFTVKVSQVIGPIPFSSPDIVNGKFVCRLENATLRFMPISITLGIFITIPLLLSSSGISLSNRIKMVTIGLFLELLFQSLFLFIVLYEEVYRNYHHFLQKGVRIDQVITYTPAKAELISWLYHFSNNVFQFVVAVGIWIGLVSYYKRSAQQGWIHKLF
jgi:hypothetical protein